MVLVLIYAINKPVDLTTLNRNSGYSVEGPMEMLPGGKKSTWALVAIGER